MVLFGTLDQMPSCPFTCFDMPGMVTMLYGWALGQGPLDFPPNVGLRIGSGSSYTLSTLQMHYSNPLAAAGVDDLSGLSHVDADAMREHDAAVIAVGVATGPGGIRIPPRQSAFAVQAEGTLSLNAPVQAFTFSLHAHKAGTRLYAWVLRDGAVLQLIAKIQYAFDLQSMWPLAEQIERLGDAIRVYCEYDTVADDECTLGGDASDNERAWST